MSQFIVSARKYRPTRFDDVVGQGHVSTTLKSAIANDHLAHAFLFCGPRGVGKTTCARILAKVLNCEQVTKDNEPCGSCDSCQSFANNASLNIYELDAASNNSVDHIRSLTEQVRFAPQLGKYKIYIIDEVHMLSTAAFNAFLKTLEEPPSYAIFILATTEKHKIIPTILSRCQIFDFKRITIPEMVSHLQQICQNEQIDAEEEALNIIAQKADGALRDALSIFDRIVSSSPNELRYKTVIETLNILDYDYFFKIVDELLNEDMSATLLIYDQIIRQGFSGDIFLTGLAKHIRDLLMSLDTKTQSLLEVSESIKLLYLDQAKRAPKALLLSMLSIINDCDVHFKTALNKRLHVELALIRMTYIRRAKKVSESTLASQSTSTDQKKKLAPNSSGKTASKKADQDTDKEIKSEDNTNTSTPKPLVDSGTAITHSPDTSQKTNENTSTSNVNGNGSQKNNLIDALKEEIIRDSSLAEQNTLPFNLENVKEIWQQYMDEINSKHIKSLLTTTQLYLNDESKSSITFVCQSSRAQDAIQKNGALRKKMIECFNLPSIIFDFDIQAQEQKPPPKPKLPQSDREKYVHFLNLNGDLKSLQKEFQLLPKKKK